MPSPQQTISIQLHSKMASTLPYIGEANGHAVFLLNRVPPFEQLWPRLHLLADQLNGQLGVIVAPIAIQIPHSHKKQVASLRLQITSLGFDPECPFAVDLQPGVVAEEEINTDQQYWMRHTGSSWMVHFLGDEFSVKDTLGARYIAHLLAHPSTVFDASQLKNFMLPNELDQQNTTESTTEMEGSVEISTKENVIRFKKAPA